MKIEQFWHLNLHLQIKDKSTGRGATTARKKKKCCIYTHVRLLLPSDKKGLSSGWMDELIQHLKALIHNINKSILSIPDSCHSSSKRKKKKSETERYNFKLLLN